MCAALAYLSMNRVEESWLLIMENVQQNEKLNLFLDYFVKQWLENQNVPIEVWNINKNQHRTNNAIKCWNSKLAGFVGKQQRNVFLQVQKLKVETEFVSRRLK
jgi:hypothetical protein